MYIKLLVVVIVLYVPSQSFADKKQCKPYLEKLRNVQSLQKSGYSNKRGRSLAAREEKARDKWWQCEQGKLPKKKSKKKIVKKHRAKKVVNAAIGNTTYSGTLTNKLVIKSDFKGIQQQAWLNYYQPPKNCRKPQSTKQFAFCMEDRRKQQDIFKRQYINK